MVSASFRKRGLRHAAAGSQQSHCVGEPALLTLTRFHPTLLPS
jgi:hypothetical protein